MRKFEQNFGGGQLMYPEHRIRNGADYQAWKEQFAPQYILRKHQERPRPTYSGEKQKIKHSFGGARPVKVKVEVKREFFKREK